MHINCLATLANMASFIEEIHSYAANRLVQLFDILTKKYKLCLKRIKAESNPETKEETIINISMDIKSEPTFLQNETDFSSQVYQSSQFTTYSDFLHMVLKIINSILTHSLSKNPHLIYGLLEKHEVFEYFSEHERFGSLIGNILKVKYLFFFQKSFSQTIW